MRAGLLDVNFLVALMDRGHAKHSVAREWFRQHRQSGWATCPLTENGCVRILGNAALQLQGANPGSVARAVQILCSAADHLFWPDSVSLTDPTLFRHEAIHGHKQITDVYLLGLAVPNDGRLATFDHSIPLEAVRGATAEHLVLL